MRRPAGRGAPAPRSHAHDRRRRRTLDRPLTKLFRVALLAAVVIGVALAFGCGARGRGLAGLAPPPMLLGFAALAALNSLGLLPQALTEALAAASRFLLVTAVAGIGARTALAELRALGWRPLALVIGETAFLFATLAAGILLFR